MGAASEAGASEVWMKDDDGWAATWKIKDI
jgi:hypothetical protein